MPWECRTVKDQRKAFAAEASKTANFSALCRKYGITRKTGYKWLERSRQGCDFDDRSRRPRSSPRQTPPETEQKIVALRGENPGWGAATIHRVLENQGTPELPCIRTVNNVLNRYHCISQGESLKRQPFQRFEKEACNQLWQTDFKGEFQTADQKYCYPLDILDDHSRFAIRISATDTTANVVIPSFQEAFREFGLPDAILSDNGAQFAGFRHGYTQFEKWLMCLDILPIHGRVRHPQTQGKIERFHRSMKDELLRHTTFANAVEANAALQQWREKYNTVRPHEALNMRCPAEVYTPSARQYPETISNWEYSGAYHVIKVNSWGYVRYDRFQIYLSETMIDEYIEFRPAPGGETFFACFRNYKIAEFRTEDGKLDNRRISKL